MTRLIDADALKKAIDEVCQQDLKRTLCWGIGLKTINRLIDYAPTVKPDMAQVLAYENGKASEKRPQGEWIPVETRALSAEEVKEVNEKYGFVGEEAWCICSPLPADTQEVLITTKYGDVVLTEFCVDDDGCWFDGYEDRDDVLAWMPLPKPYTKEEDI